jgi:hypothetical protein
MADFPECWHSIEKGADIRKIPTFRTRRSGAHALPRRVGQPWETEMRHYASARLMLFTALAAMSAASPALAQRMHYLGIAASSRETVFQSEVSGAGSTVGSPAAPCRS